MYTGGVVRHSIHYLSIWGTVLESCDPYPGMLPDINCKNDTCAFYRVVTEWQRLDQDDDAIKDAIYQDGPVMAKVYTDSEWNYYTGTYCFAQQPYINHNVLVVGWDDDMCGGYGGWIIKNSASDEWGDDGYCYISYGFNGVTAEPSQITAYKDWDPNESVYYYDDRGCEEGTGYGDGDDWAMIKVIPDENHWLQAINLWAVTGPLSYEIRVYDDFNGSYCSTLLLSGVSGTFENPGFYTIDLPKLVPLQSGDPVYIAVRFNGYGFASPIPYYQYGTIETDKCFISDYGIIYEAFDMGGAEMGDVGIRARANNSIDRGDFAFFN